MILPGTPTYHIPGPLVPVPATLPVGATFPWSAWRPDLFGLIAITEFARTDWRCITVDPPKPFDDDSMFRELEWLIAMARDERADLVDEILDQANRLDMYFLQMLNLSPSNPNAIKLMEMARRVGEMVGVHFKLTFNRARPQQIFPGLIPLLQSPGTGSYPSGHSLESHLVALALGEAMPDAKDLLWALADRIARNREVAGVHWNSDSVAGAEIAKLVFPKLLACPIFQTVLALAQAEPSASGTLTPPPECPAVPPKSNKAAKSKAKSVPGKRVVRPKP